MEPAQFIGQTRPPRKMAASGHSGSETLVRLEWKMSTFSTEYIRNELKSLFGVPLDHTRWATSELLNLVIVRDIAEVFELPPTHLPFALVLAILLVIN